MNILFEKNASGACNNSGSVLKNIHGEHVIRHLYFIECFVIVMDIS